MKNEIIKSFDNEKLYIKIYEIDNPKGAVQVVHGMMEHQDRYEELAHKLNKIGYVVVTSDLRGHGKNAKELGFFKEKLGYEALVKDQIEITKYIKNSLNISNVIIFGHSMGSIITRVLIKNNSNDFEKVILTGFPNYNPLVSIAVSIGSLVKFFKGSHKKSKLLHSLALGPFEKAIKNSNSNLDWLSVNSLNVYNYINDNLCGFEFSNSAYLDLFHLLKLMGNKKTNNLKNLPILMLCGENDPCTGGIKGIKSSVNILKKQGFSHIRNISYPGFRHEILNENENEILYKDITNFIEE